VPPVDCNLVSRGILAAAQGPRCSPGIDILCTVAVIADIHNNLRQMYKIAKYPGGAVKENLLHCKTILLFSDKQ
jgi:hypothetical protein